MKKVKIALAAVAFVAGISGAVITKANTSKVITRPSATLYQPATPTCIARNCVAGGANSCNNFFQVQCAQPITTTLGYN